MSQSQKFRRGPWAHRVLVFLFAAALSALAFWFIGYVLRDIDTIDGPNLAEMYEQQVPSELIDQRDQLYDTLREKRREIDQQTSRRDSLKASIDSSQQTMNQLLELQRLSLEKDSALPESQQAVMSDNLALFLDKQQQSQQLNETITALEGEVIQLEQQQYELQSRIDEAQQPINEEFERLQTAHRWKLAAIKLGVLIPLLLLTGAIYLRSSGGIYAPLINALSIALALRVFMVMHDHFPEIYFRYILILTAIAITGFILIRLLRSVAFPKRDWLVKQYREAYTTFVCPVCEFPIRRGPLKFAFWNRRSLRKMSSPTADKDVAAGDKPYTCPCCSTTLYETCEKCGQTRHSLLPSCDKCGHQKEDLLAESA